MRGRQTAVVGDSNKRVRITAGVISAFLRDTLRVWPAEDRGRVEIAFRSLMVHEYLPLVADMRIDDLGQIWLRERELTGPASHWDVFSAKGSFQARVELPPHRAVLDVSNGRVVLLQSGQFGEDIVTVYLLDRRST